MVVTGVSVKKGQGVGELLFFDRDTYNKVFTIPVTNGAVSIVGYKIYITDKIGNES